MIHLRFIYLAKSLSDLINVIYGKNFCQGHWRKRSNFCIKYINVCQANIKPFLLYIQHILYMTFIWLVSIKRAKVYASWRNALTDLSDSASNKIEEIFRHIRLPWHCYIAHTQGCTKLFITERRAYS